MTLGNRVCGLAYAPRVCELDQGVVLSNRLGIAAVCRRTNTEAQIYQQHYERAVYALRQRGAGRDLSEDLVHDAYLIVLAKWRADELDCSDQLGGYLVKTSYNLWLNHVRKVARRADVSLEVLEEPGVETPVDRTSIVDSLRGLLSKLISELGQDRDQLVLFLVFIAKWEKPSICSYMEIRPDQFDRLKSRAVKRLIALARVSGESKDALAETLHALRAVH